MRTPLTRIGALVALVVVATAWASADAVEGVKPRTSGSESSSALNAAMSGAGELIVFERTGPRGGHKRALYTVDPAGGEPTLLRDPGEYAHWSPNGSELSFLACMNPPDCTTALSLLDRATGEVRWYTSPDPALEMACSVWAPSGKRLACGALARRESRNGVYSVRASDGQGLTRITQNPGGEDGPVTFSPDGTKLLFVRFDPSRPERTSQALFVTSVKGGQPHRITPWGFFDDWAGWSPDGRTIVFGVAGLLFRVRPNGHGMSKIHLQTADPATARTAFDVSFSPDGTRIVFSAFTPPGIYTARPDGSDVQRLTRSPTEDHHANWGVAPGT